jgi:hypothetical protein
MFKKFGLAGILVGILITSTTANATVITDTITQTEFVGWWDSYSYTHDLTDDGFNPGTTTATGGTIKIQFSDDGGFFDLWETILIVVDEFDGDTGGVIGSASSFVNEIEVEALAQINSAGTLDVTIQSVFGDFFVGESVLSVNINDTSNDASASVPAPGILGMLGLGLLGIGVAGRIRKT